MDDPQTQATPTRLRDTEDRTGTSAAPPGQAFRILAIDGGGIRGVAPAAYLSYIESALSAPIHRYFDLLVGTSTGGIIALALARGIKADTIMRMYQERGPAIFERRHPRLARRLAMCLGPLYHSEPLHEELRTVFGADVTLGDAQARVCVPVVNTSTGSTVVFKTRHHDRLQHDYRLPMWQVAAATSAAPTYFRPVHIPGSGWFVDGGLWANSPALVGVAEAVNLGYPIDNVRVLSIGTGTSPFCVEGPAAWSAREDRRFGLLGWGEGLVDLVMRSQGQGAANFISYLLAPEDHVRVDFELPDGARRLDDVKAIPALVHRAQYQARTDSHRIRQRFFSTETAQFAPVDPLTSAKTT